MTAVARPDEPVALKAFVTIGSRFNQRAVVDSAVPIDLIPSARSAKVATSRPPKFSKRRFLLSNSPHPTTPDGDTHIRSATLRGLSPNQTLVLVNGKRCHTSVWVNTGSTVGRGAVSTDLNAIPPSAIGRIEDLRAVPPPNTVPTPSRASPCGESH